MQRRLAALAAALWWGSLSATGLLAVPLLFSQLPSPALAGRVAAALFSAQTWLALACGLALLLCALPRQTGLAPALPRWARAAAPVILGGMLLALLVQFGVAPRIQARQDLRFWHGLGTLLYALQWCCALAALWRTLSPDDAPEAWDKST